jgi:hypothetical protein
MVDAIPVCEDDEGPAWCAGYLTTSQFENMLPRTRWAVLLDHAPLSPAAHHIALRLHLYAVGSTDCTAHPSIEKLTKVTGWSRNPVRAALGELEVSGWIKAERRKYPSGKRASTLYWLTWPEVDVMASPRTPRCLAERASGPPCSRAAGWGTDHPGTGRCSAHDDPVGGQEKTHRGSGEDPPRGSGEDPLGGHEKTPSVEVGDEVVKKHRALARSEQVVDNHDRDDTEPCEREDDGLLSKQADKLIALCNAVPREKWTTAVDGWRQARFEDGWTREDVDAAELIAGERAKESAA